MYLLLSKELANRRLLQGTKDVLSNLGKVGHLKRSLLVSLGTVGVDWIF